MVYVYKRVNSFSLVQSVRDIAMLLLIVIGISCPFCFVLMVIEIESLGWWIEADNNHMKYTKLRYIKVHILFTFMLYIN